MSAQRHVVHEVLGTGPITWVHCSEPIVAASGSDQLTAEAVELRGKLDQYYLLVRRHSPECVRTAVSALGSLVVCRPSVVQLSQIAHADRGSRPVWMIGSAVG